MFDAIPVFLTTDKKKCVFFIFFSLSSMMLHLASQKYGEVQNVAMI